MQPFPLQTQTFDHLAKRFRIIKSTLKEELIAVSCNGYVYDETMKNIGNFMLIEIMKSEFKHGTFEMGMKWNYGRITW